LANIGDKVYFRGTNTYIRSKFVLTGSFSLSGNINTLLVPNGNLPSLAGKNRCFDSLFLDCTQLTSIQNLSLPSTTLSDGCYVNMFGGCSNITVAPSLPATTVKDEAYSNMF